MKMCNMIGYSLQEKVDVTSTIISEQYYRHWCLYMHMCVFDIHNMKFTVIICSNCSIDSKVEVNQSGGLV